MLSKQAERPWQCLPTNFGLNVFICTTYVASEKKAESGSKGTDYAEVDKRIMTVRDEVIISVDTKVKSTKEKLNTKVAAFTTKEVSLEKNRVMYE